MFSVPVEKFVDPSDEFVRSKIQSVLDLNLSQIPRGFMDLHESLDAYMNNGGELGNGLPVRVSAITCDDVRDVLMHPGINQLLTQVATQLQDHFVKNAAFQEKIKGIYGSSLGMALNIDSDRPDFLTLESAKLAIEKASSAVELERLLANSRLQHLTISGNVLASIFDEARKRFPSSEWGYNKACQIFGAHAKSAEYEGARYQFDPMNYLRFLALGLNDCGDRLHGQTGLPMKDLLLNDFAGKINQKLKGQQLSKTEMDQINGFFFGVIVKERGFSRQQLQRFYRTAFGRDLPQKDK